MRRVTIESTFTHESIQKFLTEAAKYRPLKAEEEINATPNQLVKHNMLFVVSVAKQYTTNPTELKDLISEGLYGLVKASQRFDSSKGFKFISYAVWWIQQAIMRYIQECKYTVRVPVNQYVINQRILKLADQYTEQEIKEKLKLSDKHYEAYTYRPSVYSIDDNGPDDDQEQQYPDSYDFSLDIENEETKERLLELMSCLEFKEQFVIHELYLNPFPSEYPAIAKKLHVSYESVRYFHKRALYKLRQKIDVLDQ